MSEPDCRVAAESEVGELLNRLVGLRCERTHLVYGGSLVLYLGKITRPDLTEWRLFIDCPWKIANAVRLLTGSVDEPAFALPIIRQLWGLNVTGLTLDIATGDLCIEFGQQCRLLVFPHSVEDEHWEVRRSDGLRMAFGPNAEWVRRLEEPDSAVPRRIPPEFIRNRRREADDKLRRRVLDVLMNGGDESGSSLRERLEDLLTESGETDGGNET